MIAFDKRLYAALHTGPERPMLEYKGRSYTMGEIAAYADRAAAALAAAGVGRDQAIGIVLRNRPLHAFAVLGMVADGRAFTSIYAMQSPEMIAEEVAASGFAAVIADAEDWSEPLRAAVASAGAAGIVLTLGAAEEIAALPGSERRGQGEFRTITGEAGLEILSSGTTGKPKRILFPYRMLVRAIDSVMIQFSVAPTPHIETLPFTGIGGMTCLVANPILGRYTVLLEKFNVPEFVEAARRLRPTIASGPPTVVRMLLDAEVDPADLSSIRYWFGGGAAFSPDLMDEFKRVFGVQAIWAYGATEFCGTLISWTPALHETHGAAKAGSVGKVLAGLQARIVDVTTGAVLPPGHEGYLEALIPDIGPEWIRTTDLMMIDEDGFAFHRGRGDGAILRGGFKVLPEKIVAALLTHPAVLDAAVIGVDDRRLGQVPVAAVQPRADRPPPTEAELMAHVRPKLVSHHRPTRILIIDPLPRTTSLKVQIKALRETVEAALAKA